MHVLPLIASPATTLHRFYLCLILGNDGVRERNIVEGCGVLLTIVDHPPEHIGNGLPFVRFTLILVHNHPHKA